jgi:hypothetical protein
MPFALDESESLVAQLVLKSVDVNEPIWLKLARLHLSSVFMDVHNGTGGCVDGMSPLGQGTKSYKFPRGILVNFSGVQLIAGRLRQLRKHPGSLFESSSPLLCILTSNG